MNQTDEDPDFCALFTDELISETLQQYSFVPFDPNTLGIPSYPYEVELELTASRKNSIDTSVQITKQY